MKDNKKGSPEILTAGSMAAADERRWPLWLSPSEIIYVSLEPTDPSFASKLAALVECLSCSLSLLERHKTSFKSYTPYIHSFNPEDFYYTEDLCAARWQWAFWELIQKSHEIAQSIEYIDWITYDELTGPGQLLSKLHSMSCAFIFSIHPLKSRRILPSTVDAVKGFDYADYIDPYLPPVPATINTATTFTEKVQTAYESFWRIKESIIEARDVLNELCNQRDSLLYHFPTTNQDEKDIKWLRLLDDISREPNGKLVSAYGNRILRETAQKFFPNLPELKKEPAPNNKLRVWLEGDHRIIYKDDNRKVYRVKIEHGGEEEIKKTWGKGQPGYYKLLVDLSQAGISRNTEKNTQTLKGKLKAQPDDFQPQATELASKIIFRDGFVILDGCQVILVED